MKIIKYIASAFLFNAALASAQDICANLLSNGIRDTTSTDITESRFSEVKNNVCTSSYDSYSKAASQAANGAFDMPGVFGINASTANQDSEYSKKWQSFCSASFAEATSNFQFRTLANTINQRILTSFDHCVDVTTERFIRYVEPQSDGRTFTIIFENKRQGNPAFTLQQLTIYDTTSQKYLDPTIDHDCDLHGKLPYNTAPFNALTILCHKNPTHEVKINAKTDAGFINVVTVPAVKEFPPTLAQRLVAAEAKLDALEKTAQGIQGRIDDIHLDFQRDENTFHDIATANGVGDCPPKAVAYGFKNTPVNNWALDMWRCVTIMIYVPPRG